MPAASLEVGWVKHVGDGLSRVVFGASVDVSPDPGSLSFEYVVLLPSSGLLSPDETPYHHLPLPLGATSWRTSERSAARWSRCSHPSTMNAAINSPNAASVILPNPTLGA